MSAVVTDPRATQRSSALRKWPLSAGVGKLVVSIERPNLARPYGLAFLCEIVLRNPLHTGRLPCPFAHW
jgi:hypothetical protein